MQHYEIKVVSLQLTKDDGMRPMGPKREVAKSKTTCFTFVEGIFYPRRDGTLESKTTCFTVNDNMMINKY